MTKVLLIEDDFMYSDEIKADLTNHFADAKEPPRIDLIETEREFRERFDEIALAGYDFIIVDVMVKWESRERDKRRPDPDVLEGGYYRAGFRCIDRLRADLRTASVRILVHTNIDERFMSDFQKAHENEYTRFIEKSGSAEPLLAVVRQWIPVNRAEPVSIR